MSKETRNSGFERKSRKSRRSAPKDGQIPRKARGIHSHSDISVPQSPKSKAQNPQKANSRVNHGESKRNHAKKHKGTTKGAGREGGALWIWGRHAVQAVLNNPKRTIHNLILSEAVAARIKLPKTAPTPEIILPAIMDKMFPRAAAHQGFAAKVAPLEWPDISDIAAGIENPVKEREVEETGGLILILDQITDPQNVGAMLRLASAFGVRALIMQDRKAPPLGGATAKVAVGCLETVPVCLVTNIANTIEALKKQNWMVIGLAGETELSISEVLGKDGNMALVVGAEGPGLRERVRKSCDQLARIPMMTRTGGHNKDMRATAGQAESLNVATAAAVALYEARRS